MLTERQHLLKKLLTISHLTVPEQRSLVHSPTFSELLEVAEHYFQNSTFLPAIITEWDGNRLCYDGYSIEKAHESYILHFQSAGDSLNLYANDSYVYCYLKDALYAFLCKEHQFNIDGVPILDK